MPLHGDAYAGISQRVREGEAGELRAFDNLVNRFAAFGVMEKYDDRVQRIGMASRLPPRQQRVVSKVT